MGISSNSEKWFIQFGPSSSLITVATSVKGIKGALSCSTASVLTYSLGTMCTSDAMCWPNLVKTPTRYSQRRHKTHPYAVAEHPCFCGTR